MNAHPAHPALLSRLWEIQEADRFISDRALTALASEFAISEIDVEGVVSFYHFFHRQPAGKYTIYLDDSILACQAGFEEVRDALEEATGAPWNGVDPTGTFGLFETSCIGLSDQVPAALINFHPFTRLTPDKATELIKALRAGADPAKLADKVKDSIRYLPEKPVFFADFELGRALEPLYSLTPEEVIDTLREANLLGMGGAFFPAATKFELCRRNAAPAHYLICNADEGEPGTFKDRALLQRRADLLIEGMIVGGYAIGAKEGFIYLRAEYRYLLEGLQQAIERYRKRGWLGTQAPTKEPFEYDVHIFLGAGAYVCGEETALISSMEGRRGEPWPKTHFPTDMGYLGQPTVVNNVETLCAAAKIMEIGPEAWKAMGTPRSPGTKLLSVAGDCRFPGIYEIEWGMSIGELLEQCGAIDPWMIQLSGPSGICVSMAEKNRTLCAEDLLCGGAVTIFDGSREMLPIMLNFTEFFKRESCGVCTPCRAGNFILERRLEKLSRGLGSSEDLEAIRDLGQFMTLASRCGLGKASARALLHAMQKFPASFRELAQATGPNQSFDLTDALADYHRLVGHNYSNR